MDADAIFARLALTLGWISQEVHDAALSRVRELQDRGIAKSAEDVLRESKQLQEGRLRILRRLLSRYTQQTRVGDYILVRRIGIGGTGMVFEARHRRIGRRAAVKILFPRLERERGFSERFLREAKVLAQVNHPNVVHAYDAGRDGEFFYIATEMVEGGDLRKLLEEEGRLPIDRAVSIGIQVARGLESIHRAGLVHRDVKPANILVPADAEVKLVDLGLHFSEVDRQALPDGLVFGTPQYMSPEQIRGAAAIDRRTDLYSLGATLYHALTSRPLFPGRPHREVVQAQLHEPPLPPLEVRPDLPRSLDALIVDLLKKNPDERPDSASEVVRRLEAMQTLPAAPATSRRAPASRARAVAMAATVVVAVTGLVATAAFLGGPGLEPTATPSKAAELPGETHGASGSGSGDLDAAREHFRRLCEESIPEWSRFLARVRDRWPRFRKVFRDAIPRLPMPSGDIDTVAGESGAGDSTAAGESGARDPEATAAERGPTVPESAAGWVEQAARTVRRRFEERLRDLEPERRVHAILRGRPVRRSVGEVTSRAASRLVTVRVARSFAGVELIGVGSGERIPILEVHPAMVLAWGALSGAEPEVSDGVGYAVDRGRFDYAARILRELRPPVPDAIRAAVRASTRGEPAGAGSDETFGGDADSIATAYLDSALASVGRASSARAALEAGRWEEAITSYEMLLRGEALAESLRRRPREWSRQLERARRLGRITTEFFHVAVVALEPATGERIQLVYPFDDRRELDDWRLQPGAFELRDGELVCSGKERIEVIDTIAIFRPPVTVEGLWSPAPEERSRGRLIVSFGSSSVGIGGAAGGLQLFRAESEDEQSFLEGEPTAVAGPFRIEWTEDRLAAELANTVRIDTAHSSVPRFGRVAIRLERRAALAELAITGTLNEVWTAARIRQLQERERE